MKNKKIPIFGKRSISLTALALAVCMILGLALKEPRNAYAVELGQNCSLTVDPGIHEEGADGEEPETKAQVAIDLYKVADAEKVDGYDTYSLKANGTYAGIGSIRALEELSSITNEEYRAIAQEAAALILATPGTSISPTASGTAGKAIESSSGGKLESGLYLMIARDAELTDPKDYVTTVKDEGGTEQVATVAHSDRHTYTFLPELVALPSRAALGEDGAITGNNTANRADWQYDLTVTLKPSQSLRFGTLEIVKNLTGDPQGEPASFVFQVDAYKDSSKEQRVYSNLFTAKFHGESSRTITVENVLPAGAFVEVKEVYSGVSYQPETSQTQTAVIPAAEGDGKAVVSFTNRYVGSSASGGVITNHFEYHAGNWDCTQE